MTLMTYLCPQCAGATEISDVEKIKTSKDEYPLMCCHCGAPFSKTALIKFARQQAEEIINLALSQLQKQAKN